ncbi:MAG: hypothetical protein ACI4U2_03925 [Christensenellaceae bacterium]
MNNPDEEILQPSPEPVPPVEAEQPLPPAPDAILPAETEKPKRKRATGAAKSAAAQGSATKASRSKKRESDASEESAQFDELLVYGKIKKAGELVEQGEFAAAAATLPQVDLFEVIRLRLLIENGMRSELEMADRCETLIDESKTYLHLLTLCDAQHQIEYEQLAKKCADNYDLRKQLERGYELLAYEYFEQAAEFAITLAKEYGEKSEVWNMIILAKSKISPVRSEDAPIEKRNASLEKYSEYKQLMLCPDYPYFSTRPEYAERYLKTKADFLRDREEQSRRDKAKLAATFERVTLALGITALALLFPFFMIFNSLAGIVIGIFGVAVSLGGLVCNTRAMSLSLERTMKQNTLSFILLGLELVAYFVTIIVAIPMIQ